MANVEIVELIVGDAADAWRAAGFAVGTDGVANVGTVRMRFTGAGGGIESWIVRRIPGGSELDGLATVVVESVLAQPGVHPNGATIIDHVVIASGDVDRTVATFVAAGCEPRRERIGGSDAMPIRQVFVRAGEVILEIIGSPTPDPAHRERPASFWGLAFSTADIVACGELLGEGMGTVREAVQPGRLIATLRGDRYGISVPTVLMSE